MDTNFQGAPAASPTIATADQTAAGEVPHHAANSEGAAAITILNCLRWVMLYAVPVMLKLTVMTFITTDLSPVPMIWVAGEGLYWLSWVLVILGMLTMRLMAPLTRRWLAMFQAAAITAGVFLTFTVAAGEAHSLVPVISTLFASLLLTALVCHAELLKDGPRVAHLWVLVSCGVFGMGAGEVCARYLMPLCFPNSCPDFQIALVLACLLRPTMSVRSLFQLQPIEADPNRRHGYALDLILPIALGALTFGMLWSVGPWQAKPAGAPAWQSATVVFGVALGACMLFSLRPWRFGIAIGILFLLQVWQQPPLDLDAQRVYFGAIRVEELKDAEKKPHKLLLQDIDHGINFLNPKDNWGPVGSVMENSDWFRENAQQQMAKVRLPASLVGLGALNIGPLPATQLVGAWAGTAAP